MIADPSPKVMAIAQRVNKELAHIPMTKRKALHWIAQEYGHNSAEYIKAKTEDPEELVIATGREIASNLQGPQQTTSVADSSVEAAIDKIVSEGEIDFDTGSETAIANGVFSLLVQASEQLAKDTGETDLVGIVRRVQNKMNEKFAAIQARWAADSKRG